MSLVKVLMLRRFRNEVTMIEVDSTQVMMFWPCVVLSFIGFSISLLYVLHAYVRRMGVDLIASLSSLPFIAACPKYNTTLPFSMCKSMSIGCISL